MHKAFIFIFLAGGAKLISICDPKSNFAPHPNLVGDRKSTRTKYSPRFRFRCGVKYPQSFSLLLPSKRPYLLPVKLFYFMPMYK